MKVNNEHFKERKEKISTFCACISLFQMMQVIMKYEIVFFTECHLGLWCETLR